MKNAICLALAAALVVLFSMVNLFLPYALVVAALFVGLGVACRTIQRRTKGPACPLGYC